MTEVGRGPRPSRLMLWGLSLVLGSAGCSSPTAESGLSSSDPSARPLSTEVLPQVVVLGFDGVDPDHIEALWAQGKLPHLKQLAQDGSFSRLGTTQPPQSPVAWASFATGTNPGQHGIYDFIARDPRSYRPKMGALEYRGPSYGAAGELLSGITGTNLRRGPAFWQLLSDQGVEVEVLNVPYSWPPEPVPLGGVASGLGVPDLRPTNSTSTVFSSDFGDAPPSPGGVRAVAVPWNGVAAQVAVQGPRAASSHRSSVRLELQRMADLGGLKISGTSAPVLLKEGHWSEWQTLRFGLGAAAASSPTSPSATGQVRFYLEEASAERIHLYVSAVGADPADPFVALSHPSGLALELQQRGGRYNTVGWEEDTSALSAELLPDQAFFDDLMRTMVQREAMTLGALDDSPPPLLISVWTGTDRASHMFWRLTDPAAPRYDAQLAGRLGTAIDQTYEQMDRTVGKVRALLPPDALLLVLSDHGFHSFSRGFHVNRWLADKGYLALKAGGRSLADADWSNTRAYALGTGQIYLNLQGREGQGTVAFGAERDALLTTLQAGLLALRDDDRRPLAAVQAGASLYAGPAAALAPDLLLSFAPGYQASWATRLGGVPGVLFEDNQRKWSGDHASSLAAETEGVLFTNRGAARSGASIEHVAATILQVFDRELPPGMDLDTLF